MATTTPTVWAGLTKANVADAPDASANASATNEQSRSKVIALADGGFFLTWEDWSGAYNSGLEPTDITARTFDVLGLKTGTEVNASLNYNDFVQQSQAVTQLSDGKIAVAYQSTGDPLFGDLENIDVSLFSGSTYLRHDDFREFSQQPRGTFANDTTPAITALSDGRYVVIYARDAAGNNDLSSYIVTQGVDANNNNAPIGIKGPEVLLESSAASATLPDAVTLTNGNYVVVYQSSTNAGDIAFTVRSGTDSSSVAAGTVAAGASAETAPQVAALKGGGFVVVWNDASGDGANNAGIKARVYNATGTPAAAFTVNTTTTGVQSQAAVTQLADGGFLVAWADDASNSVKGQRYSVTGIKVGTEFSIAAAASHDYTQPDLALLADGRVVVSVTDNVAGNKDIYTTIIDPRDSVTGTAGSDVLTSRKDGAVVQGLGGIDTLYGYDGNDQLNGGSGNDSMSGGRGNDTYIVSDAGDVTTESVSGAAGGTDLVISAVARTLGLNLENLTLSGTAAISGSGNTLNNVITGNGAANTLSGGEGNDTLNGGLGGDIMAGGAGNDTYFVNEAGDVLIESIAGAAGGTDLVFSAVSRTLATNIENLTLTGTLAVSATGNALGNVLTGNSIANILNGSTGNDRLTGGGGNDFFVFATALSATANSDTITDFVAINDTIRLENAIFTRLTATGALSAAAFWSSAAGIAHDLNDRIVYNTSTGVLTYDSNGSQAGGAVQFAVLTTKPAITSADFVVI